MPKLAFTPSKHGFHFANNFENYIGPITTYGRCGGMALTTLDYYYHNLPVPTHRPEDFGTPDGVPPHFSRLSNYIYDRLLNSLTTVRAGLFFRFITADTNLDNHYSWSVNDEFPLIKGKIDANQLFVLGLRARESDLAKAHQVVAYGYEENPPRVYIYDNNLPDQEVILEADPAQRRILHICADGSHTAWYEEYASYFLHDIFEPDVRPPYIDLGLQEGLIVRTQNLTPAVGERLEVEVCIHNFGDYPARVQQFYLYVRGPHGENLDYLLGANGDNNVTSIPPGEERRIGWVCNKFGEEPGSYRIGLSYLSLENQWIMVPAFAGGTQQEVVVELRPGVVAPSVGWNSLGGVLLAIPAAGRNQDGRIELFGLGTDAKIWHLYQSGGGNYSGWEQLDGETHFRGSPSVVLNNWDKLEIFARGDDYAIWHRWQNEPNVLNSGQWSTWWSLGGDFACDPTAWFNQDRRLEVFGVGRDGKIYHTYQRFFLGNGAPWSGWELLAGGTSFKGRVAAHSDASGRIHLLARATNNTIWVCYQLTPGGAWSGWQDFSGVGLSDPALARNGDGRLEAFVLGTDNRVWHRWQLTPNGNWSGWMLLNESSVPAVYSLSESRIATVTRANGILTIAVRQNTGGVAKEQQIATPPWWDNWVNLGGAVTSDIVAANNNSGSVELFALGSASELIYTSLP